MTILHQGAAAAFAIVLIAGACSASAQTAAPAIPFAPPEDTTLKDPDNPIRKFRVDVARVEHEFPLSREDRMKITPENLQALSQDQVDQIYGRLTAGPIPDGQYFGDLFFARGDSITPEGNLPTRLGEILGGVAGRAANININLLENFGRHLWKGKVFYRDERVLRNMIQDDVALLPLVGNPLTIKQTAIRRDGLIGRLFQNDAVWLLFPGKLYCGQSLLDTRRESVIVDYHYTDDIEGYREMPDSLAGRGGLRIRDGSA